MPCVSFPCLGHKSMRLNYALILEVSLAIFISLIPYAVSADVNYNIPAEFGMTGTDIICIDPPYDQRNFLSYRIGTAGPGSNDILETSTTGNGLCNSSFDAPGNITGAGSFWLTMYEGAGYTAGYGHIEFLCNGGSSAGDCEIIVPDYNTFIRIISPPPDTASTTFDIEYEYYIDGSSPEAEFQPTVNILFQLCPQSYPSDACERFVDPDFSDTYNVLTSGSFTVTTNREGYYLALANFWNDVSTTIEPSVCPWWDFRCQTTPGESPEIGVGTSTRFNVATTTIDADVPEWILDGDYCGGFIGIIDAAFCNALVFLFVPEKDFNTRFQELQNLMINKQPWGFFALVQKKLDTAIVDAPVDPATDLVINVGTIDMTVFSWTWVKDTWTALGFYAFEFSQILLWIFWLYTSWTLWRIVVGSKSDNAI